MRAASCALPGGLRPLPKPAKRDTKKSGRKSRKFGKKSPTTQSRREMWALIRAASSRAPRRSAEVISRPYIESQKFSAKTQRTRRKAKRQPAQRRPWCARPLRALPGALRPLPTPAKRDTKKSRRKSRKFGKKSPTTQNRREMWALMRAASRRAPLRCAEVVSRPPYIEKSKVQRKDAENAEKGRRGRVEHARRCAQRLHTPRCASASTK